MILCVLSDEWMLGVPCPTKRGDFAIGFQGGKLIAAGGLGESGHCNVEKFEVMCMQKKLKHNYGKALCFSLIICTVFCVFNFLSSVS